MINASLSLFPQVLHNEVSVWRKHNDPVVPERTDTPGAPRIDEALQQAGPDTEIKMIVNIAFYIVVIHTFVENSS